MRHISGIVLLTLTYLVVGVTPVSDAAVRPAINEVRIIGHSVKGLPIRAYRVGEPTAPVKAVFIGSMHGDETGPSRILDNLLGGDPIKGASIWIVPNLNPDGVVRGRRQNAHGVDLNRNFPVGWVHRTGTYYSGPWPASEPETRAAMRLLRAVQPDYVIGLHQPLYGVDVSYVRTRAFAWRLSVKLQLPRKVFSCGGVCRGTMTQWFNHTYAGAALTVEYGRPMTINQVYRTGPTGMLASVYATR